MDASQVYNEWKNRIVVDSGGEKVGSVEDVYLDRDTQQPEWALIAMGLFGSRHTLVPLTNAEVSGNRVQLPYDSERVRTAPAVEPQGELSEAQEQSLYRHYELHASTNASPSLLAAQGEAAASSGGDTGPGMRARHGSAAPASAGDTMQLAEEQVDVRKTPMDVGEVRLGKKVVTEHRDLEVSVRREVLMLERRPVRRLPRESGEIGETLEVVIQLQREQVQVEKRPIVREEVAVAKRSVEETQHVETDVQKEVPRFEREGEASVTGDVPEEVSSTT